jgi:hypothetical protein
MLVMAGVYATTSEWISYEMDYANSKGIPIIGVVPRGQERISKLVQNYADEIVKWYTESIIAAIRRHSK